MLTQTLEKGCAAAILALFLAACGQTPKLRAPEPSADGSIPTSPLGIPSAAAPSDANAAVGIDNFAFTPQTLKVTAGTTVTWTNHDDVPHTATSSADPRLFNSGALDTDQKFSFTFKTPGRYDYYCLVHPHMTGTILVK